MFLLLVRVISVIRYITAVSHRKLIDIVTYFKIFVWSNWHWGKTSTGLGGCILFLNSSSLTCQCGNPIHLRRNGDKSLLKMPPLVFLLSSNNPCKLSETISKGSFNIRILKAAPQFHWIVFSTLCSFYILALSCSVFHKTGHTLFLCYKMSAIIPQYLKSIGVFSIMCKGTKPGL